MPDLAALEKGYQASQSGNTGGGLGGFLHRNASTIGSIAAPAAATFLAPETGGASLLALAALGGGAGAKVAGQNVGKGAAQGAIGELTGRFLGKGLGFLGKGVTKPVASAVERKATTAEAQQTLKGIEPFMGVKPQDMANHDLGGTINMMKNFGIEHTPENMHKVANLATGENGAISSTTRGLLENVGPINTGDAMAAANKQLLKEGVHLSSASARKNALESARLAIQDVANKGEGSLKGQSGANESLDAVQALEDRINKLGGTTAQGANGAEARILKATRDSLMQNLDEASKPVIAAHTLDPESVAHIQTSAQNIGSPALGEHIIGGINNASKLSDLRGLQKPFVNASKLAEAADTVARGKGVVTGAVQGAKAAAAHSGGSELTRDLYYTMQNPAMAPFLANAAVKSGAATDLVAKGAKPLGAIEKLNNAPPGGLTTGGLLSRVVGQGLSHSGGQPAPTQSQVTPDTNTATTPDLTGGVGSTDTTATDNSPFSQEKIQNAVLQDISNTGGKNVNTLLSLYKTFNAGNTAPVKPSSQQVGSAQSGEQSLQQVAQMLQANPDVLSQSAVPGGGLPVVGGLINRLTGTGQYKAAANNTLDALARIRTGAAISKQEESFYHSLLPQPGDNQQTIDYKLQQLQSALAPYASAQIGGQ